MLTPLIGRDSDLSVSYVGWICRAVLLLLKGLEAQQELVREVRLHHRQGGARAARLITPPRRGLNALGPRPDWRGPVALRRAAGVLPAAHATAALPRSQLRLTLTQRAARGWRVRCEKFASAPREEPG